MEEKHQVRNMEDIAELVTCLIWNEVTQIDCE